VAGRVAGRVAGVAADRVAGRVAGRVDIFSAIARMQGAIVVILKHHVVVSYLRQHPLHRVPSRSWNRSKLPC